MSRTYFNGDVWASDYKADTNNVVRPTSLEIADGWLTATYPNRKWENWAKLAVFESLQWIEEKGVFDWDPNITYSTGALVNYSGITYISILASNLNQQPDTATTYWQNYYDWLTDKAGLTLVAENEAALGTGVIDGQPRWTEDGRAYRWDDTASKWVGQTGNQYTSTPGFGNVVFEIGTIVSINGANWRYNGENFEEVVSVIVGALERPEFVANASSTQIDIKGPFGYHLYGVGWVWATGTTAYNFTTLAASTWSYLYIDKSTITSPGGITAANLIDSATAPTYDTSKGGWYNGDDRCIFAVYGTGASAYTFFYHDDTLVHYEEKIIDLSSTAVTTTWTDVTLTLMPLSNKGLVTFIYNYDTANASLSWRKNGSSGSGHGISRTTSTSTYDFNQVPVFVDSTQKIEVSSDVNGGLIIVHSNGFYLPKGI